MYFMLTDDEICDEHHSFDGSLYPERAQSYDGYNNYYFGDDYYYDYSDDYYGGYSDEQYVDYSDDYYGGYSDDSANYIYDPFTGSYYYYD